MARLSLAEAAEQYASLGWALVQLEGKMPVGYGWQNAAPLDPQSSRSIWEGKSCNMGLVLGPSGVIDFELDSGDRDLYWNLVGGDPYTPTYFTGSGKPHVLFSDPGGTTRRTRDGLELRAGHHQSVIPPSIHPDTGEPYRWMDNRDPMSVPLADPPKALLDFFSSSNNGPSESHWRQPLTLGTKLGKGEGRHASLISFLGKAVNIFDTVEQLYAAALFYAQTTQDPPYPEEHIFEQVVDTWHRYRDVPEDPEEAEEYLKVLSLDKIKMKAVEFLWKPYLQRSAFHLLVGRKGAGKGSVLAWVAANMTVGMFDQDAKDVLWIATEDSFEIDVKPRIIVQGGVERRVHAVRQNVLLPRDLPAIRGFCEKHNIGLVVIDPIVGVIGDADTNSEGPIVAAIGGLNQMADDLDMAVIGVRHTGKNMDAGALQSVLGSVAWVNTPRAVLGIKQDENKIVSLEVIASNRVRSQDRTYFRLEEARVRKMGGMVSKVVPLP